MLSPSMITKSKPAFSRYRSICAATSYCSFPPVPLSPITANRTDPDFSGRLRTCPGENTGREMMARKRIAGLRENIFHPVNDKIRFRIQKNKIATHDAILNFRRQPGKIRQKQRWCRLQRNVCRVTLVYMKLQVDRLGVLQARRDVLP